MISPSLLRYHMEGLSKFITILPGGGVSRDPKFVLRNIWTAPNDTIHQKLIPGLSTSLWLLKILTSSSRAGFYFENPEVRNRKGTWSGLAIRRLGSFWPTLCQRGESFLWSGWNSQRRGILPFLAKLKRHTLKMHELRQIFTLHT